jgi:hypothetical protein
MTRVQLKDVTSSVRNRVLPLITDSRRWESWIDRPILVWSLLGILTVIGLVLRIYRLEAQSIWRDEAISWSFARQPTVDAVLSMLAVGDLHPPLWYLILHQFIQWFGESEFSLRFPAMLCGVLVIPIGFLLGVYLFNNRFGLLNALILSLSPFLIRYSQEARHYSLLAFVAGLTIYAFVRWHTQKKTPWLLGFSLAMTATLYTHNWGFFLLVTLNLLAFGSLLIDKRQRMYLGFWLVANLLICVLYLPWLPVLLRQLRYQTAWMAQEYSAAQLLLQTLQAWTAGWRATAFYLVLLILGILPVTCTFKPFRLRLNDHAKTTVLLTCVCFIPLLIALVLSEIKPIYKPDRYTIMVFPAFSLLFTAGIAALRKPWLVGLVTTLVVLLWLRKDLYYLTEPYKSPARDVAAYVTEYIDPDDVLVFAPDPIGQSFNYYFKGKQFQIGYANWNTPKHWRIDGWVEAWFEPGLEEKTLKEISNHLNEGACIWFIYTPGKISVPQAENKVEQFRMNFSELYTLQDSITFPELFEVMQINLFCQMTEMKK